jgi:signal transduction histidine kinase
LGNIGRQIGLAIAATRAHEEAIQGQAWLRAVVENAPEGVLLLTNNLTIKAVSPATFTLVAGSQTDPAGWRGKKLEDLLALSPEGVKGWGAMVNLNSLNQHAPMEGTHPTPGRFIHWRWTPLWQYGQPLGWLLRLQDVTQAQRQTQLHNELIQMTIHDLRNPLSALDGCLTMIEDSERPLPTKELLQVMRRSLQGMQELVDTILDVNQLENGKLSLHIMPFSLPQVVEEVLETQTVLIKQHELTLHTEFPADLPLAWGDPLLLRRVVQNLCDNAIKFTPRGGHITWQIEVQHLAGAQKLLVTVKDSGLGIPTELQQRIFQEFSAGRHQRGGNGLGLTFCKMALEAHGEQITVQSEPGRGTTFVFTLATQPLSINGHLGDLFNSVRYAA